MANLDLFTKFASELTAPDLDFNLYLNDDVLDGRFPISKLPFPQVVNVKAHGALGDDGDDTTAVHAALAAAVSGDIVYFPKGTYTIKSEFLATVDNITMMGDGAGSIIKAHQTPTVSSLLADIGWFVVMENLTDFKVTGLEFQGPATGTGYDASMVGVVQNEPGAVVMRGCSRCVVDDVRFIYNGTFKGGTVFITGDGDVTINIPSNDNVIRNCYAEKAGPFTYAYGMANRNLCEYNRSFDSWANAYSGVANAFQPTYTGSSNLDFNDNGASADTIVRASGSWITDGFLVGDTFSVTATTNNNTEFIIRSIAALTITLDTATVTDEQNTSGVVLARRDNEDNVCSRNWAIRAGRMGIEDIGDTVQWALRTIINENIIMSSGSDQGNFAGGGFGISVAGKDPVVNDNSVIDFDSIGIEPVALNGRFIGNHVEQPLWSPFLDTGSGFSVDGLAPTNDGTLIESNYIKRTNEGIKISGDAGQVDCVNNHFENIRQSAFSASALSGDHTSLNVVGGSILYTIPVDEHKPAVTTRFALGLTPNSIATGVLITYAATVDGGTGANDVAIPVDADNCSFINIQIKDNGVQSGATNVLVGSTGGDGDNNTFIGGNYNTAKVDFVNSTGIIWQGVKHTGDKNNWDAAVSQLLTGAGALNLTQELTQFTSNGAAQALTLADGYVGQIKKIWHISDGGNGVLTPTNLNGGTSYNLAAVDDFVILQFFNDAWHEIGGNVTVTA